VAELPVPPSVEVTFPVVLTLLPDVVAVTFTLTAHDELPEIVPPLRLIPVLPAAVPPQVSLRFGVEATCRPLGRLSVTATPVSAVPLGFVIVRSNRSCHSS
jgi:hypothetical protein